MGGTFTDCLALNPTGETIQTKVLSSGCVKCRIRIGAEHELSVDAGAGEQFWVGATLRLLGARADSADVAHVIAYDNETGQIELDSLPNLILTSQPSTELSCELDHQIPAPILVIRRILKLAPSNTLPVCQVHLGTTRGTNALLTRTGARTAFITTLGFRDLLLIGDQARPHLFELSIHKSKPIFESSIQIDERILFDGTVERSPDLKRVASQLEGLKADGIESVAICFMNGFQYPQHERQVGGLAERIGFRDVRLSSSVAPLIKILARSETTVLDAYLNPVLADYLDQINELLSQGSSLELMTSAGGLVDRSQFSGKDSVLSGPAGGIVGASRVAEQIGFKQALTFDMGGTSTDVGRYDGALELEYETRKSDVRIMTPMVAVETVAAGGGSICRFDGSKMVVGPQSAASDPGPACYGRGGPLTVTDVNLFLGRIAKDRFPFPLDEHAVLSRLNVIRAEMSQFGFELSPREIASGFLSIANQNMASAMRSVSIARGYDPDDYLLVAFGGAGPQHCCAVADAIGVKQILDHPLGSILSAVGIRLADQTATQAKSVLQPLNRNTLKQVGIFWDEMLCEIGNQLRSDNLQLTYSVDLRYVGTEASQPVEVNSTGSSQAELDNIIQQFSGAHQRLFGFTSDRELEVVSARLLGRRVGNRLTSAPPTKGKRIAQPQRQQDVYWRTDLPTDEDSKRATNVFDRERLEGGDQILGPALVAGSLSTTVIESGWEAQVLDGGQLLLEKIKNGVTHRSPPTRNNNSLSNPDPITLEIFNNHFSTIARQMGISLQKTSMSVNVKERLDFSCALFSQTGDLVVNAPHIPVHLGAMSETVRAIIRSNEAFFPGDVFVTNDPFAGGSHLPDVTVVTPIFRRSGAGERPLIFWVASRSHHAEIGGISPGSMPAHATNLSQEGVLIQNFKLVDGQSGKENFDGLEELLSAPPYPSRSPSENLADIRAQVAANRTGERDLLALVDHYSEQVVLAYTDHIQAAAEQKIRKAIAALANGTYAFEDSLDHGATIRVEIKVHDESLEMNFHGTDPVQDGNMNANPAIVSSAVIYVMRCLIDEDIPLNEGVMAPVTIWLPECFLNPVASDDPMKCPAVVGGNVETSQRIVDVLLGAIQQATPAGLAAASQGTMNNWLMGDDSFGYYETIGGGSGATSTAGGADAVHTHMTNTRLTDPEVMESRYPVILREFSIRKNSGGEGRLDGGNGIIREMEFLKPLTISLLTNRRSHGAYGVQGGFAGAPGVNELIRKNGSKEILPNRCEQSVEPGDRLRIKTPGGGGFGSNGNGD